MTAVHRRAARRERQVAEVLGTERVRYRPRYVKAPDVVPIRMADGSVLVPESATRAKLPKWFLRKLEQARGYAKGAIPLVVWSQTGGEPIACLPLVDLAQLVGIRAPKDGEQLLLLGGRKP